MSWRIVGTELLDADEIRRRPRRRADVSWDNGLAAAPGSEWVIDKLRALDGQLTGLGRSAAQPVFKVDLRDRASAYWATMSLLYEFEVAGDLPDPIWGGRHPERGGQLGSAPAL
jgi:hypothetical protein